MRQLLARRTRRPSIMEGIIPLLILSITLTPTPWVTANVNIFQSEEQKFMGRDASGDVFRSDTEEIFPVAYYDINADKLTDFITVSRDRSAIDIFLAYSEKPYLRRAFNAQLNITDPEKRIVSVRPGDFTGDGMADLMVTLGKDTESQLGTGFGVDVIFCLIRFEGETNLQCGGPGTGAVINDLVQEPTVLDLNGDMVMDLLGEQLGPNEMKPGEKVNQRMIWLSGATKDSFEWKNESFRAVGDYANETTRDMTTASSNAYADVDGDNIPELMILTKGPTSTPPSPPNPTYYLETFNIVKDPNRRIAFALKTPPKFITPFPRNQTTNFMGQPLIMDFEHTGKLSHLIPFCTDLGCKTSGIYVIEGDQAIPLPLGPMDHGGMKWGFIHPKHPKSHSPSSSPTNRRTTTTTAATTTTTPKPYDPKYFPMESFYSRTIVLRVGDYNLDGYPDLLAVLSTETKPQQERMTRGVLFKNVPCTHTAQNPCNYSRTFAPDFELLERYTNIISATFYDIGENGVLDMILVAEKQEAPRGPQYQHFQIRAFENEMNFDSSFLKVMVLTGQECLRCESGIPYGNVLPGATVRYTSLNSQGLEESGAVTQTYRTSHLPLDLPSEIFGIGHSPNFIETLVVTISPNAEEVYKKSWLQIIPNSQIVVVPNPLEKPDRWTMKLFLTPSDVVLKTFGVLVAICAIFAVLTGALEFKERREDRLVRQSEAHRLVMY